MDLIYGKHGKPYLKNYSDVYFNISHSGKYDYVCRRRYGNGRRYSGACKSQTSYCEAFFSENEYKKIENICEPQKADKLFFDMWSVKESYVKATGEGIGGSFKEYWSYNIGRRYGKRLI